jgi:hypothetical protein
VQALENFGTPRMLGIILECPKNAEGRLLLQLLRNQSGGLGRLGTQQDMKMIRHQNPTDQGKMHFGSQLAKHVHKMAGQSVAAKQLDAPVDAGGDKLCLPKRKMAMVYRHGRKYTAFRMLMLTRRRPWKACASPPWLSILGRAWGARLFTRMIHDVIGILQGSRHELLLFLPGLVIFDLMIRFGRFIQLRSEGKTSFPSKDPVRTKQTSTNLKGFGLIFMGALTLDAWWNYGVITAAVVTLVFLLEIRIVMRWRRVATPPHDNRDEAGSA